MPIQQFLDSASVFTRDEFHDFATAHTDRSSKAVEALLGYYKKKGDILGIRRRLYVSLQNQEAGRRGKSKTDPYLVAAKTTEDAVIAHAPALALHCRMQGGRGCGAFGPAVPGKDNGIPPRRFVFLTNLRPRPTTFGGYLFEGVGFPVALRDRRMEEYATAWVDAENPENGLYPVPPTTGSQEGPEAWSPTWMRVTTPERTLVDMLDRPDLSEGFDAVWRLLPRMQVTDLDAVLDYAELLGNATTIAKLGFYLEMRRNKLPVTDEHLERLASQAPLRPHYLERTLRRSGRLAAPWNLVVPESYLPASRRKKTRRAR